ncbi:MAG: hypothetical protein H7123_06620 [Thermoleophilia bacterium]|nr:hypothetical protein [Thermoleophilia bacterium]
MSRTFRISSLIAVALFLLALPAAAFAQTQMHLPVSKLGAKKAVRQIVIDQAPSAHDFTITCAKRAARKFRCNARWIESGADDDYRANTSMTLYLHTDADKQVEARTLVAHYKSYCQVHGKMKCFDLGTVNTPQTWDTAASAYLTAD